jgi:iron complex outermembrane recepter protein
VRIFFVLLLGINLLCNSLYGQSNYALKGMVADESNQALTGATVFLYPVGKGTTTDLQGRFSIDGIDRGTYRIEISFMGYKPFADTITITGNDFYRARLSVITLNLHEVVIHDNYSEERRKEEPLNIEIVNDEYLKQNLGGSLMKSLERLPGITTIDIGSGQSKPVIRGLGFNRVVVVENDIKHEGQQWGVDHGLEIDQYAVEMIEVIKGPASIMYGSDAIGGVIDLKSNRIPSENTIGGTVDLTYKSNNEFGGGSVFLYGRKKWFFADLRVTLLDYADYKVPADSIDIYSYRAALYRHHMRNTAGNEQNVNASFGIALPGFKSRFFVSDVNGRSGFFANAYGLEPRNVDTELHDKSSRDINYPYHGVNHFKIINQSRYTRERWIFETDLGFQRNFRQEFSEYVSHGYMPAVFPDTMGYSADLELQFEKYVYSGNLKLTYDKTTATRYVIGVNSDFQDNRIDGRGFIIPAFKQFTVGGFILGKHAFTEKSILQAAVRYDYGHVTTQAYYDWFPSPEINEGDTSYAYLQRAGEVSRGFSSLSWSVGYNFNPGKWSYKANLGKSFRIPVAKELAANGVNYHTFSYEVGDTALSPEVSYQFDAGVEYGSEKFAIGITPFMNYFSNYIYLNPTSEHDRLYGNGNQVFYYTQARVLRYGIEIHAHYQLIKPLQLGFMGEYVYSEQLSGEKKGFTLPFSPPPSALVNLKFQKPKVGFIGNAYCSIDYRIAAPQNHIVPPEETTTGYQVVNISFGGDVRLGGQQVSISFQVQNLLNNKYYNHTSYYRLLNVPEPGTNFIINVTVPFGGSVNNHKGIQRNSQRNTKDYSGNQ